MHRAAQLISIVGLFAILALAARWMAGAMLWDFKLTYLAVLILASGFLSLFMAWQRRRLQRRIERLPEQVVQALGDKSDDVKYALPTQGARSSFITVSVGILGVNIPTLPILIGPFFVLQTSFSVEPPMPQFIALGLGFVLAWTWWSIAVTKWRQWAKRGGMTAAEVQYHGEKASILWPRGSLFEKTELGNLLARHRNDA